MYIGEPVISLRRADKVRTSVIHRGATHKAKAEATKGMNEVFESLGPSNVALLAGRDVLLHLIPYDKQLTDLPEFASRKAQRTPDGKAYDLMRSTGPIPSGQNIVLAIGEEDVAYMRERRPHLLQGFAVSHDSGLVVAQFALTSAQKNALQQAFQDRHRTLADWVGANAGSSPDEYFASSTAAFFGHSRSVGAPDPARFTPAWLAKNDPTMYALLQDVYQRARK